jgi:hypothetical protein
MSSPAAPARCSAALASTVRLEKLPPPERVTVLTISTATLPLMAPAKCPPKIASAAGSAERTVPEPAISWIPTLTPLRLSVAPAAILTESASWTYLPAYPTAQAGEVAMATVSWLIGLDGNWHTGVNWSTGSVPNPTDDAVFQTGAIAAYRVSLTSAANIASLLFDDAAPDGRAVAIPSN